VKGEWNTRPEVGARAIITLSNYHIITLSN
jgi:hypothetical protein